MLRGALSGWENGKFEPDFSSLTKMSEIFGESIDYILTVKTPVCGSDYKKLPLYKLENYVISDQDIARGKTKIVGDVFEIRKVFNNIVQ